jgi:hypothetical protein
MFEQKRFAGRHLLTLESQKLNYFGKKVGPQFSVIFSNISMIIMYYEYMTTQYFERFFFIHLKPRVESLWGVLSCCLTPSILFNFRYKKIKT